MSEITVYTKPNCMQCRATIRALDSLGISHMTVDLTDDADARDFVMGLGYLSAPVVVVDLDTHWSGFRDRRITALAAA